MRKQLADNNFGQDDGFRWRGGEVSRVEALSDAAFAFAITLLVVSLEAPRVYSDLTYFMYDLIPFAICFGWLMVIWYYHYKFFRRYGLEDLYTITLNGLLLFLVLFYIYPLKFLARVLFFMISGVIDPRLGEPMFLTENWPDLMTIYSSGFLAIFLVFVLLQLHALRQREALQLNALEIFLTRFDIYFYLIYALFGLASTLLAYLFPEQVAYSGMIYFLIGPVMGLYGYLMGRREPEG